MSKTIAKPIFFYLFASLLAFFILIPFFWMISTSLKSYGALMSIPIRWIPETISFKSYAKVFVIFPFARAIFNSAFVSVLSTVITILSASMAAYVFAKIRFKGRERLFLVVLATMMIPSQVTVIPIFLVLKKLGLINTFTGLIAPTIFNAFAIFMLRQHMKDIPDDFIDAAVIDGASYFRIFRSVILPLSMPIITILGVITFMGAWNDYFWPLVILYDKAKMTLSLALSQLNGQHTDMYNILMAGSLLSMIPIIVIYIFAQKYFMSGLQLGGIKG